MPEGVVRVGRRALVAGGQEIAVGVLDHLDSSAEGVGRIRPDFVRRAGTVVVGGGVGEETRLGQSAGGRIVNVVGYYPFEGDFVIESSKGIVELLFGEVALGQRRVVGRALDSVRAEAERQGARGLAAEGVVGEVSLSAKRIGDRRLIAEGVAAAYEARVDSVIGWARRNLPHLLGDNAVFWLGHQELAEFPQVASKWRREFLAADGDGAMAFRFDNGSVAHIDRMPITLAPLGQCETHGERTHPRPPADGRSRPANRHGRRRLRHPR